MSARDAASSSSITSLVSLRTLGGLALFHAGQPIHADGIQRKRLALLAVLAFHGPAGVSRDTLLALLWPESDSEHARSALKQAVYALRRMLGEEAILGTTELRLNPGRVDSDVGQFHAAAVRGEWAAAVQAYTGTFLSGVHISNAAEFETWADDVRRQLEIQYREARTTLAESAERRGAFAEAVPHWRALADSDPLNTTAARRLVIALARTGDAASALQRARAHEALVRAELGVLSDAAWTTMVVDITARRLAPVQPQTTASPSHERDWSDPGERSISEEITASTGTLERAQAKATSHGTRAWLQFERAVIPIGIAGGVVVLLAGAVAGMPRYRHDIERFAAWTGDQGRYVIAVPTFSTTADSATVLFGSMARSVIVSGIEQLGGLRITSSGQPAGRTDITVRGTVMPTRDSIEVVIAISGRGIEEISRTVSMTLPRRGSIGGQLSMLAERVRGAVAPAVDRLYNDVMTFPEIATPPPTYASYAALEEGNLRYYGADMRGALPYYKEALGADSTFPWALISLAKTYYELGEYDSVSFLVNRARSLPLSPYDRAELDTQVSRFEGNWLGAERASIRLLALAPSSDDALEMAAQRAQSAMCLQRADSLIRYGPLPVKYDIVMVPHFTYHGLGDYRRALSYIDRVLASRPHMALASMLAAMDYGAMGDADRAQAMAEQIPSTEPGSYPTGEALREAADEMAVHGHPDGARALLARAVSWFDQRPDSELDAHDDRRFEYGEALVDAGLLERAKRQFQIVSNQRGTSLDTLARAAMLGLIAARSGDTATVHSSERLLSSAASPYSLGLPLEWRARIELALGDTTRAIASLRSAFEHGLPPYDSPYVWDPLHQMPDMQSILSRPELVQSMRPRSCA